MSGEARKAVDDRPARIRFARLVHAAKRGDWGYVKTELGKVSDEEIDVADAARFMQIATKECVLDFLASRFKATFGTDEISGVTDERLAAGGNSAVLLQDTGIPPEWVESLERVLNGRLPMTVADLLQHTPEKIAKVGYDKGRSRIGKKGWKEIRRILAEEGLVW